MKKIIGMLLCLSYINIQAANQLQKVFVHQASQQMDELAKMPHN